MDCTSLATGCNAHVTSGVFTHAHPTTRQRNQHSFAHPPLSRARSSQYNQSTLQYNQSTHAVHTKYQVECNSFLAPPDTCPARRGTITVHMQYTHSGATPSSHLPAPVPLVVVSPVVQVQHVVEQPTRLAREHADDDSTERRFHVSRIALLR